MRVAHDVPEYRSILYRGTIFLLVQTFRHSRRLEGGRLARCIMQFSSAGRLIPGGGQMEPIEYKTVVRADDVARMVEQLNELGAQGWEVCDHVNTRMANEVGFVTPRHEVLVLKRHKEA
jgi:hypothetical protein